MSSLFKILAVGSIGVTLFTNPTFALAQENSAVPVVIQDDVVITNDRFESFNRGAFEFNDGWDQAVFKPIAKGYKKVVPAGSRGCVHGFFENLSVPYTAVNNVLQGKIKAAGQDLCRFVVNSTVGVGGCFDIASKWNIPKHDEDFGQTLGKWGVPPGPFVMLPLMGPSTLRDALAKPIDFVGDPIGYVKVIKVKNSLRGLKVVDTRTTLLETLDFVDDVAIDRYSMMRDAWMQKRAADVRDEDYAPDEAPISSTPEATAPTGVASEKVSQLEVVLPTIPSPDNAKIPNIDNTIVPVGK